MRGNCTICFQKIKHLTVHDNNFFGQMLVVLFGLKITFFFFASLLVAIFIEVLTLSLPLQFIYKEITGMTAI